MRPDDLTILTMPPNTRGKCQCMFIGKLWRIVRIVTIVRRASVLTSENLGSPCECPNGTTPCNARRGLRKPKFGRVRCAPRGAVTPCMWPTGREKFACARARAWSA